MAVEARHLNLFPSQLIGNREIAMNSFDPNVNSLFANAQSLGYGMQIPIAAENLTPSAIHDPFAAFSSLPAKTIPKKSDSGITTYNNNNHNHNHHHHHHQPSHIETTSLPRKRQRESPNEEFLPFNNPISYATNKSYSFLGEDVSLQINHQQFHIDRLISQHMEKVRIEIEEKRKSQARRIVEAIEIGLAKRLRAKEEEIEKIGKLNWALEEKLKSMFVENQIWRDLATTNEATVNALRSNLENLMAAQVSRRGAGEEENDNELVEDAQSSCGENDMTSERSCRNCGRGEACVLLLPCRHLCLCGPCGSSLHVCPICKSTKNASVNVNMSS